MKEDVLAILKESQSHVSGEKMSEQLACSRTAIWKAISQLKKEGYPIEAQRNLGYKLTDFDLLNERELALIAPEYKIHYIEQTGSTQQVAMQLLADGADTNTVVVAGTQTSGRGRLGRVWQSEKYTTVSMSMIIKPTITLQHAPKLTLVAAVAVARALSKYADVSIKWPNDILINGKKVCGILTELQADPDRIKAVIIGIGINVNNAVFDESLEDRATSLAQEAKQSIPRVNVIERVLTEWTQMYALFESDGFTVLKPLWEAYATSIGATIRVRSEQETLVCTLLGITDDGYLRVQREGGEETLIISGDIDLVSS
ncbi:biotin--[acetyl-CoA-carboxylase] ligase [Paenalkalicoccus suaedae]|uniref:Bifunctional ligase/repressor BirA n=1 Tax=Paenalkalicoccus suaedae TaxID=2592382 RepID=A0A859FE15_9BACI|nr:biotin--[acetyl-CoA-carboxylase] ligase [Paenalkalicoccus suaedae]QKS71120.1 biotin--[acetyl-CoA-carboxylase] ligase [Paenalkalicoccus suaedae]